MKNGKKRNFGNLRIIYNPSLQLQYLNIEKLFSSYVNHPKLETKILSTLLIISIRYQYIEQLSS